MFREEDSIMRCKVLIIIAAIATMPRLAQAPERNLVTSTR
jgi:hypothetical protein